MGTLSQKDGSLQEGEGKESSARQASEKKTTATATALWAGELELVERHRYGDPEAFEEVYHRFEKLVYNLALRMSGDPDDAADLSQDVFLRIYRKLGSYRGGASLKTWVFRVALNCCRSRLRRRQTWKRFSFIDRDELPELPDPASGPDERAVTHDLEDRIGTAIRSLPLPFREAVVLRDLHDFTYREIADVLGLRLGTVRSRIARGRNRLRPWLESLK